MAERRTGYSIFEAAFVARRAAKWGFDDAACEYWGRHVHDTYRIEGGGRRAYLRVYRRGWRSAAEVQAEVDLLRFLHRRGVAVAPPVAMKSGRFVDRIEAAEGPRHAVLFAEAPGQRPAMDAPNSAAYGRAAAALHAHADACRRRLPRPVLDLDYLARAPLAAISKYWVHRPREVAVLRSAVEVLVPELEAKLARTAPAFGLCHGDLHFGNVLRDAAGRFTLLDFDCAGYGWRAHDLSVFLWSRGWAFGKRAQAQRASQWNAFLEGYDAVRPLAAAEVEAARLFVPLHQLWVMALWIGLRDGFGPRWLTDAHFDTHVAFVRGWMKRLRA